jgi:hypothetical protein
MKISKYCHFWKNFSIFLSHFFKTKNKPLLTQPKIKPTFLDLSQKKSKITKKITEKNL